MFRIICAFFFGISTPALAAPALNAEGLPVVLPGTLLNDAYAEVSSKGEDFSGGAIFVSQHREYQFTCLTMFAAPEWTILEMVNGKLQEVKALPSDTRLTASCAALKG